MLRRLLLAAASAGEFAAEVAADAPYLWWRANEGSGSALADNSGNGLVGYLTGAAGTDYSRGLPSVISAAGGSIEFMTNSGGGRSSSSFSAATFSHDATFMVVVRINNSAAAGTIIGMCDGDNPTGTTGSRDRVLAIDPAGKLRAGVWSGAVSVITSPSPINDGATHVIHFTMGSNASEGCEMYIDGASVGSMPVLSTDTSGIRFLYIGTLNMSGWAGFGSGAATALGRYQDIAVFPSRLSAARIAAHAQAAGVM